MSRHLALATAILLLAAGLRLWALAALPPGLYFDEAYLLLRAQEVLHGAAWPWLIPGNGGYEPLFVYLSLPVLWLLGPVNWAGRLVAAWAGLLAVACTIRAGREFFPRQAVGLWAGLGLAALFSQLTFSRFGVQPILAVPAAAGTLAAFWHGARTGNWWAFALAGVCLGLGLDAYVGFRLFPLVLSGAALALFITARGQRRRLVVGSAITLGAALVVFAPIGWAFAQQPEWFLDRFQQTTGGTLNAADPVAALSANTLKTLGGLFAQGDANWRHNFAGRPLLDGAQTLLVLLGLGLSLRQWRQPATWVLLLWLGIGLLPSALTDEAPHFGRMLIAAPALALLLGQGTVALWQAGPSATVNRLVRSAVAVAWLISLTLTGVDFFGRWAHDPHLIEYFMVEQTWVAQALRAAPPGSALYLTPAPEHMQRWYEPLRYQLGDVRERLTLFDGQACQISPNPATGAAYAVVTAWGQPEPTWLQANPAVQYAVAQWQNGVPFLEIYTWPATTTPAATDYQFDFGAAVQLVTHTLSAPLAPGQTLTLSAQWRLTQRLATPHKLFLHFTGPPQADGNPVYAQRDAPLCAGSHAAPHWNPGEIVAETYTLTLPPAWPPGEYALALGWYDETSGARLPVTARNAPEVVDAAVLATWAWP